MGYLATGMTTMVNGRSMEGLATEKLLSSFEFNYLGKRIRDDSPYKSFKSQFFTDLNFSYQANENARFFLNIDNLFNRHDIISSSSSTFYNLGRNFLAGVEYKF